MDSFISMTGWTQPHSSGPSPPPSTSTSPSPSPSPPSPSPRAFGHLRSLSSITGRTGSPKPQRASLNLKSSIASLPFIFPSASSSAQPSPIEQPAQHALAPTTPTAYPPALPPTSLPRHIAEEMSTIPDPRIRALTPSSVRSGAATTPDLNDELATLSAKLINAINYQTNLDDTLSDTRRDLATARERIRDLENQVSHQRDMLSGHVWIRRSAAELEQKVLHTRIVDEKRARHVVEADKRKIELELENLTTALFEEANKMVISAKEAARVEQEAFQRRNDQLKAQLADNESLLRSQREQLAELKLVMEHMVTERDDQTNPTAPSSPGFSKFDPKDYERALSEGIAPSSLADAPSPTYPTSYTQLLQPVLRNDVAAYDDFVRLAKNTRARASSRVSSASTGLGGLGALGIGLGGIISNASSTSLPMASSPSTPSHASSASTGSALTGSPSAAAPAVGQTLRETSFFKRALVEDVEPTLRLDTAPGLSWLARRAVLNAICDGNLTVEPIPSGAPSPGYLRNSTPPQFQPCSLCGEARRETQYLRNHRLRTSESDSAQRHPLCAYCLGRVRSTCDFLGFLRMVRDGHWRVDDEDAEAAAWEESVRLREHMFWARIGGGVVPAAHPLAGEGERSRRASRDTGRELEEAPNPDATASSSASTDTSFQTPPGSIRNSMQSLKSRSTDDGEPRLSISIPTPPCTSVES